MYEELRTLLKNVNIDIVLVVGIKAAEEKTAELRSSKTKPKMLWIVDEADL